MSTDRAAKAVPVPPVAPASRHAGLDWLRVAATIGVVVLHAGIAYQPHPLPNLRWATHDTPTVWADLICWPLDAWVMPVFFLLGGFVAHGLLDRLGPRAMTVHRLRRLGGPFLLGCVLILPLDLYVWLLGTVIDHGMPVRKLQSLKLSGYDEGLLGPSHLWFLQYLILYCLAAAGLRAIRGPSMRIDPVRDRLLLAVAMFASVVALTFDPLILIGFRHEPLPQPAHLAFFGAFFAIGIRCHRLSWSRRRSFGWVAVGSLALVAAWPMMLADWSGAGGRTPMAACFAIGCWGLGMGAFQFARTIERPLPPPIRYVAAASFWIYLFHHPIVGLAQIALKSSSIPSLVKLGVVTAIGLAIPLMSYQVVVRGRWIGRVLGERPKPPQVHRRRAA